MKIVRSPVQVRAAGHVEKNIYEYLGRLSGEYGLSVARMVSPKGWSEPGQTPGFREITLVISGALKVATKATVFDIRAGEAVIVEPNEWVRYSTPEEPSEYVAICLPAFGADLVNRDGGGNS